MAPGLGRLGDGGRQAAFAIAKKAKAKALQVGGGPARLQVIALLAGVLALELADQGTIAAASGQIKQAFHLGNTAFGLLLAVVSFAGAIGTIPMGVLVDRMRRKTVLLGAIAAWTAAMVLSGTATSYLYLILTRLLLGAVTAAAWPSVASLTGDFFPARERAGVYGLILGGEVIGLGIGFFVSGEVASIADWRWSFFAMAALSTGLLVAIWRYLPEPSRGTQTWLGRGEADPETASRPQSDQSEPGHDSGSSNQAYAAARSDAEPRAELVLKDDPTRRGWIWAIRYCLRIPTYRLLVIASALAYYFFSGARAFSMLYFTEHYHVSHSLVSALVIVLGAAALIGVVGGGQLAEWLLARGRLNARLVVPAVALIVAVPFLGFGIWTRSVALGIVLMAIGAGMLAAGDAPIDAARLDILHPRLWGRGEAGRMALRSAFEGSAPLVFGALSTWLGGGSRGLMWTFLVMLMPLTAASLFVFPGRKTYPRDVATAAASADAVAAAGRPAGKSGGRCRD